MHELSGEGQRHPIWVWLLGAGAKRSHFTEEGWADQRRAIWGTMWINLLAFVSFLVLIAGIFSW
jgi:hypothetical protein